MSSIISEGGKGEKCVDGVIDDSSLCHSLQETNPWFMVNLENQHYVVAVNIHIRPSKFS